MKRWVLWLAGLALTEGVLSGCDPVPPHHDPYTEQAGTEQGFLRDTYFWLTDTTFAGDGRAVANFRESYRHYEAGRPQVVPEAQRIRKLEVWLLRTWFNDLGCDEYAGSATALQRLGAPTSAGDDFIAGRWTLLDDSCLGGVRGWTLDSARGVVRLRDRYTLHFHPGALAVAFSTVGGDTFGTLGRRDDSLRLVLLRTRDFTPQSATWNLMFRHVYELSEGAEPERLDFRLNHLDDSLTESATLPASTVAYLDYLRHALVTQDSVFGHSGPVGYAEVHFRDLTPFDPSGYWEDGAFVQTDLAALETQTGRPYRAPHLYTQVPPAAYPFDWGYPPRWRLRWVSWHAGI